MDRRHFLASSGAALLAAASSGPVFAARAAQRWGVQLFTVLALLEQDFEGTLGEIAKIGYKEVETIGSFGRDPKYVRSVLEKNGLKSPSQHIASDAVYANFSGWARRELTSQQIHEAYVASFQIEKSLPLVEGAIKQAHVLGQSHVVWPILFEEQLASREILDAYLKLFNRAGRMCKDAGLTFTFHNHDREFAKLGNDVIYDIILASTDPALVKMEMDFYWINKAKADPIAYLSNNPGRFQLVHVKDMSPSGDFAAVGTGILDIKTLIAKAQSVGVKHFYVEFDRSSDPMREVRTSFGNLQKLN